MTHILWTRPLIGLYNRRDFQILKLFPVNILVLSSCCEIKAKKPALGEQTQESRSFGAGGFTGKSDPQLGIAQIAPLSFQGSHRTHTQTSEVRWLHASEVTEWSPACLHKQFPGDLYRGNLKWKMFTTLSILVLQTPFKF